MKLIILKIPIQAYVKPQSYFSNAELVKSHRASHHYTSSLKEGLITILSHHIPKTNINSRYDEWLDQVHSASALNIKFNFPAYTLFHECRSYPEMLWWTKITIGVSIKIGSFVQIIIKSEGYGYSPRGRTLILVSTDQASLWIYGLESGLAISLEIATQSGQELSPKNWQFKMTALYIVEDTWKARPETRKFNNVVTNTLARYWLIPSIMINP